MNDNGTTSIFIDGQEIIINDATEIEGIPEIGAIVEIEAVAQPDGSLIAVEIEVEDVDDDEAEIERRRRG